MGILVLPAQAIIASYRDVFRDDPERLIGLRAKSRSSCSDMLVSVFLPERSLDSCKPMNLRCFSEELGIFVFL